MKYLKQQMHAVIKGRAISILRIIRVWSLFCSIRILDKFAFSTYSFGKLVFHLFAFSVFSTCSVF